MNIEIKISAQWVWILIIAVVIMLPNVAQADPATTSSSAQAIASQATAQPLEKKGKNWKIKVSTMYVRDDNVVAEPTDDTVRPGNLPRAMGNFFEWSATGGLIHKFNDKLSLSTEYDAYQSIHQDSVSSYDLTSQIFGLSPTYKITPLMQLNFDYKYIWNIVDKSNYSGIHYLSPSFNYMHKTFGLTRIFFVSKIDDNWQNEARDHSEFTVGATQYYPIPQIKNARISFGYKFITYNSDDGLGRKFNRTAHEGEIKAKTPLFWDIKMDAGLKLSQRGYDSGLARTGVLRDDTQQKYSVALSRVLAKDWIYLQNLTLHGKYRHLFNHSNLRVRDYKSNLFELGLKATF